MEEGLTEILEFLHAAPAIEDKANIRQAFTPAMDVTFAAASVGDDCAAIPDQAGGFLLLAAEGLLPGFVAEDPWFAGYCAVMVNVSDICAMGGRPIGVVDVLWTTSHAATEPIWDGMRAAARDYAVPIVGGHTTLSGAEELVYLAAAILGRARSLLTSFDARPGDVLLMAVDLGGSYRRDKPFWNASVGTDSTRLRSLIELLPRVAENGWCRAAKDISNGGIVGTLLMLIECSGVGAILDLDAIPKPDGVDLKKWLISFPSYGYLLSVDRAFQRPIVDLFAEHGICCEAVGEVVEGQSLEIRRAGQSATFEQGVSHA